MTPDTPTRPANDARHRLNVDDIIIPESRLRAAQEDAVATLAESMDLIGQRVPITVRQTPSPGGDGASGSLVVVAGAHRLLAAKHIGWEQIDVIYLEGNETDARLWEIAENLHRAELTELERAEQIAEWIRLTEEEEVLVQVATKLPQKGVGQGVGGGRPESGIRAAARAQGCCNNRSLLTPSRFRASVTRLFL